MKLPLSEGQATCAFLTTKIFQDRERYMQSFKIKIRPPAEHLPLLVAWLTILPLVLLLKKKKKASALIPTRQELLFFSFTGVAESPRCSNSSWHSAAPLRKGMAHLLPLLELPAHANSQKCIQIIP